MQNKQAEVAFFNQFGDGKEWDAFSEDGYQRIIKEFEKLVQPKEKEVMGDFGCGTAPMTFRLQEKFGLEAFGLDLSDTMIQYNSQKYPHIKFLVKDIEETGFDDECFDIIVFSGVLHHFPNFHKVLEEAHRLLKKGGRIFAFDPHYYNPFLWIYRADESPLSSRGGLTENERLLTKAEIRRECESIGYKNINVGSISGVSYKYVDSPLIRAVLMPYNLMEKVMDVTGLGKIIGSFIITYAEK